MGLRFPFIFRLGALLGKLKIRVRSRPHSALFQFIFLARIEMAKGDLTLVAIATALLNAALVPVLVFSVPNRTSMLVRYFPSWSGAFAISGMALHFLH